MIKLINKVYLCRIIFTVIFIILITERTSNSVIDIDNPVYDLTLIDDNGEDLIKMDFDEIIKRGTIRMITRYSPTSYFLMDGRDRGFEYELVMRFARDNDLKVEVILIDENTDPIQVLESGKGDLIADHFTISEHLRDQVNFSTPYNYIYKVYDINDFEIENASILDNSSEHKIPSSSHQKLSTRGYFEQKSLGMKIEKIDSIAWVTRKNAPELKKKMDAFISKHFHVREMDGQIIRSAYLNNLIRRYFERDRFKGRYHDRAYDAIYTGYLSPYDDMIKPIAEEAGVDWILVIAVMAQESAFNPQAVSMAGALGLMQIIPRFSEVVDESDLFKPEVNIREGVRYLKNHLSREAHLDSLNRHSMALAAYNVGMGNLADARELAVRLGKDPDEWSNIANALLKLMDPYYYRHARYGYKRGIETVNYVEDVLNRYSRYRAIYQMTSIFKEGVNQQMIVQKTH